MREGLEKKSPRWHKKCLTSLTVHGTIYTERQGDNTMEKMTKRDYFNRILAYAHEEDKEFILHELDLLAKKNERKSSKPSAKQLANATFVEALYEAMEIGKSYTIADLQALVPELADASSQKVSALVKRMKDNALVSREVVKGKAYFTKI